MLMVDAVRACARAPLHERVCMRVQRLVRASRITDTDGYARQEPEMAEIAGAAKSRDPLDDLNEASERAKRAPRCTRRPRRPLVSPILAARDSPRGNIYTREDRELGEVFGLPNEALKFLVPPGESGSSRNNTSRFFLPQRFPDIRGAREDGFHVAKTHAEKEDERDTLLRANLYPYIDGKCRAEKPKIIPRLARCVESTSVYITGVRLCNASWTGRYAVGRAKLIQDA